MLSVDLAVNFHKADNEWGLGSKKNSSTSYFHNVTLSDLATSNNFKDLDKPDKFAKSVLRDKKKPKRDFLSPSTDKEKD